MLDGLYLRSWANTNKFLAVKVAWLEPSDAPLGEIARHCGYLAPSAFTRMFTASAGCHPDAYRQQYRDPKPRLPRV